MKASGMAHHPDLEIESLDHEGRGVAHANGKVIFVDGALAGERVSARTLRSKAKYETAETIDILRASSARVTPRCKHFGVCGGCSMQHLEARTQVAVKQRVLENSLWHIGRIRADTIYRPVHGPDWAYRYRARLSVRKVPSKGLLLGFHQRKSSYITNLTECHVLPPHVAGLLVPLRELIASLSVADRLPQVEVAVGENVTVLVLRILHALSRDDEAAVRAFADTHGVNIWLQPGGPDTTLPFHPALPAGGGDAMTRMDAALQYDLPEFGIHMPFRPTDFTQVNPHINRVLVRRAVGLLDPQPHERIVDLFCGLGNFTLPIATRAREVLGIEGSAALVRRAEDNASASGLGARTRFMTANLFETGVEQFKALGRFDKALIDPPRDGALALVKVFAQLGDFAPERIVYVSCNPSTLARDAAILATQGGYRLTGAGIVNMFPHTSHVESVALFDKSAGANPAD